MDISPDGTISFLTPNAQFSNNKMEADRVYSTLADLKLPLKTAKPTGYETLTLFCSAEKIKLFDANYDENGFYTITKPDEARLQALLARLDLLENAEW